MESNKTMNKRNTLWKGEIPEQLWTCVQREDPASVIEWSMHKEWVLRQQVMKKRNYLILWNWVSVMKLGYCGNFSQEKWEVECWLMIVDLKMNHWMLFKKSSFNFSKSNSYYKHETHFRRAMFA